MEPGRDVWDPHFCEESSLINLHVRPTLPLEVSVEGPDVYQCQVGSRRKNNRLYSRKPAQPVLKEFISSHKRVFPTMGEDHVSFVFYAPTVVPVLPRTILRPFSNPVTNRVETTRGAPYLPLKSVRSIQDELLCTIIFYCVYHIQRGPSGLGPSWVYCLKPT